MKLLMRRVAGGEEILSLQDKHLRLAQHPSTLPNLWVLLEVGMKPGTSYLLLLHHNLSASYTSPQSQAISEERRVWNVYYWVERNMGVYSSKKSLFSPKVKFSSPPLTSNHLTWFDLSPEHRYTSNLAKNHYSYTKTKGILILGLGLG